MHIKEITNKQEWENFVLSQTNTLFVQSIQYGEFYTAVGEKAWIFGIYDEKKLIGGSLVVSTHAKRGNFLYLPYGPILPKNKKNEALNHLVCFLRKFASSQKEYHFVRVSPFLEDNSENKALFKNSGFRNAPMHVLAETTWMLDITKSEEQLLQNMNKNHRNLIRRCEREKVEVKKLNSTEDLNKFFELYDETARRHKFHKFSRDYITKEFENFSKKGKALVFQAWLPDGRLDSSAIIMYYGKMAAYRHGASLNNNKKIPTSYLLQWKAIKEAQNRGMNLYNFWGIAPENSSKKHPFKGITHFKKGFGGFQKDLLHCQDLPLAPKYYLNWLIETSRRIKRGF